MKWLIGIVSLLTVTGCATPLNHAESTQFVFADTMKSHIETSSVMNIVRGETITNKLKVTTLDSLAAAAAKKAMLRKLETNAAKITNTVQALKKTVGHTWYAFSGASPRGWDCSGLVMWAYQNMGITLEHRASLQKTAGPLTTKPKVGDIVAFTYKNSKYGAYHVGIYLGEDMMINAPRPGAATAIESISKFAGNYSEVTYTRILDTL
jgi:cell wall-associated NlpC family hydrolase